MSVRKKATNGSSGKGLASKLGRVGTLSLIALFAVIAVAVGLVAVSYIFPSATPESASERNARIVAQSCAGGDLVAHEGTVEASLTDFFHGIKASSSINSKDVGAIIDKIIPNDTGLEFYKEYTKCLKQQTIAVLAKNGIKIHEDGKNDDDVFKKVEDFNINTPIDRLRSLLGSAISVVSFGPDNDEKATVTYYQYKHSIYVADIRQGDKRLGMYVQPFRIAGFHFLPTGWVLNDTTIRVASERCGPVDGTVHGNLHSSICGGSHLDQFTYYEFFFDIAFQHLDGSKETPAHCSPASLPKGGVDISECPELAGWTATGVAISGDKSNLGIVRQIVLHDMDSGSPFTWPADAWDADGNYQG